MYWVIKVFETIEVHQVSWLNACCIKNVGHVLVLKPRVLNVDIVEFDMFVFVLSRAL